MLTILYLIYFGLPQLVGFRPIGYFELGRFADLLGQDIIIGLLIYIAFCGRRIVRELRVIKCYERLRWERIKDK